LPFSETRCADRYVAACLTTTFRSQGFSPSQRFDPSAPLRLCFTPHPLVGFRPSELLPPEPAVTPLDAQCSHAIRPTPSSTTSGRGNTTHQPTIRAQALTSELCSGLASDTPYTRGLAHEAAALLAFFLSKACQSVGRPETEPAPHVLGCRSKLQLPTNTDLRPVLQGTEPTNLGSTSEEAKPTFLRF
jgi:hypothetical protein